MYNRSDAAFCGLYYLPFSQQYLENTIRDFTLPPLPNGYHVDRSKAVFLFQFLLFCLFSMKFQFVVRLFVFVVFEGAVVVLLLCLITFYVIKSIAGLMIVLWRMYENQSEILTMVLVQENNKL